MRRPLVIGYGNPLREDDALGWRAAEVVEARAPVGSVEVVKCHQLTPELVYQIVKASFVLFLDAAQGIPAGRSDCTAVRSEASSSFTHHLTPGQISWLAEEMTGEPPAAFLITGGVDRMGWRECLTPKGALAVESMAEKALELLRQAA